MSAWLHVSPLPNAEGESGWIVISTRSHPFFAQVITRDVPYTFLRHLPHLDGWWVDDRAREYLFAAIAGTTHVEHLCPSCAHDGAPCDVACVMAAARGQAAEQAAAMYEQMVARENQRYGQAEAWSRRNQQGYQPNYQPPPYQLPRGSNTRSKTFFAPRPIDPAPAAAKLLGVRWPGASNTEIQKAFRVAIMKAHPDLGGTDAQAVAVTNARKILLSAA